VHCTAGVFGGSMLRPRRCRRPVRTSPLLSSRARERGRVSSQAEAVVWPTMPRAQSTALRSARWTAERTCSNWLPRGRCATRRWRLPWSSSHRSWPARGRAFRPRKLLHIVREISCAQSALRHRLGLTVHPSNEARVQCACGQAIEQDTTDHALRCPKRVGEMTLRHDVGKGILCRIIQRVGVASSLEPTLR
jgi:hypothetical protein